MLLDEIIANQDATVVAENHNLDSINWVRGLSDPGEMLACGYLPQARRRDGESDEDYRERLLAELPESLVERIRNAAVARAGLDTSNGRVNLFVAGETPWHNLGVVLSRTVKSKEAIVHSGLGFTVDKRPLFYHYGGLGVNAPGTNALVRTDTGSFLSAVGDRYQPIQNSEAFSMLDEVIGEHDAYYEAAGSLYGGKNIFILARMPRQDFAVDGSDEVHSYILVSNVHGYGKAHIFATNVRVVCANTLRQSLSHREKGISISHLGSVMSKVADARRALGIAVHRFEEHREESLAMAEVDIDCREYFSNVLDKVLDVTQAQMDAGVESYLDNCIAADEANRELAAAKVERMFRAREMVLADIIERYDSERCDSARGSAWSAFNAVTEAADFGQLAGRQIGDQAESRRFESIISGQSDDVKQVARQTAIEMMKI